MATAIDFQALMREEKARAIAELGLKEKSYEAAGAGPEDDCQSKFKPKTWKDVPDVTFDMAKRVPLDLEEFRVGHDRLGAIYYIPDFVAGDEAARLKDRVDSMPDGSWTNLRRRRLQNHGGSPHPEGMSPDSIPKFMSCVMKTLVEAGVFPEEEPPNHVLMNEYKSGQGIMPHKDGPLYKPLVAILSLEGPAMLCFWESIAAARVAEDAEKQAESDVENTEISAGGDDTVSPPGLIASVLCLPRSLLIFSEEAYTNCFHGIAERSRDVIGPHTVNRDIVGLEVGKTMKRGDVRISYTVRRVLKVKDRDSIICTAESAEEERRKERWWLASRGEEGLKLM